MVVADTMPVWHNEQDVAAVFWTDDILSYIFVSQEIMPKMLRSINQG
jgi:hypothetical protein